MTALPDVLSVDDLRQLLDCSAETVEDETRARRLPGLKFGRSWIYPREAVMQVLRDRALAHVAAAPAPAPAAPAPAPKLLAIVPRPAQRGGSRQRGRSPAPLPDPPLGA